MLVLFLVSCCFVYIFDVQQGNIFIKEVVVQFKLGMIKCQVIVLMGLFLVVSLFDQNWWDYVFIQQYCGGEIKICMFIFIFNNDMLVCIEGDFFVQDVQQLFNDIKKYKVNYLVDEICGDKSGGLMDVGIGDKLVGE